MNPVFKFSFQSLLSVPVTYSSFELQILRFDASVVLDYDHFLCGDLNIHVCCET